MTLLIANRQALAAEFVRVVADIADKQRTLTLAVPGGSVAEAFLPALATATLPWENVDIFWCDERAVPSDSADSNAGMLHRLWPNVPARLHPMPALAPGGAERYAAEMAKVVGSPLEFDVVLLGVGEDGHVASIFPDHPSMDVVDRSVFVVEDAPKPPPRRMTLSFLAITSAHTVIVAAFGAAKAAVMRDALRGTSDTPVARVVRDARQLYVLLDDEAGAFLQSDES